VVAQGVGEQYSIADNDTKYGRQQNRRVELVLRPLTA
jgi:outer membrane protein OmpA-like peptidoglycan-associated protein